MGAVSKLIEKIFSNFSNFEGNNNGNYFQIGVCGKCVKEGNYKPRGTYEGLCIDHLRQRYRGTKKLAELETMYKNYTSHPII